MNFKYIKYHTLSYTVLTLLLFAAFAFSPAVKSNPFEELKALNDKYRNMKEYSMNISYLIYANYTTTQPTHTSVAHYIKKDNTIYMQMDKMQTLQTEKYLIVVSATENKLLISKPSKDVVQQTKLDVIQKALEKSSALTLEQKDGKKIFNVSFKDKQSLYEKMRITQNVKTQYLEKMELFISEPMKANPEDPKCKEEKPRMEVMFVNFKTNVEIEANKLSESYYITKTATGFEPAAAFKNYKLINNYRQ